MSLSVTPTQSDIQTVLRSFLLSILPSGVEVIAAQTNRVPEPRGADFVTMTVLRRERIETNVDDYADAVFTGSIAGTTLTITDVGFGALAVGSTIFGEGVSADTTVAAFGTGMGGVGTYTVAPSQTVSSTKIAAGTQSFLQPTKVTMQLDVHGPASGDNAQTISTMMRDDFAVSFFQSVNPNVAPLYADDPRQMPFVNEEQQVEDRYVIEAAMQANQTIVAPQQFADVLDVGLIEVEAAYHAN